MALVSTIIGSIFGFASFLVALTIFNTGFLWALAIYSGSGVLIALTLIAANLASRALAENEVQMATASHHA